MRSCHHKVVSNRIQTNIFVTEYSKTIHVRIIELLSVWCSAGFEVAGNGV
jgi:hypothetical protein